MLDRGGGGGGRGGVEEVDVSMRITVSLENLKMRDTTV